MEKQILKIDEHPVIEINVNALIGPTPHPGLFYHFHLMLTQNGIKVKRGYSGGNGTFYFDIDLSKSSSKNPDQLLNLVLKVIKNTIKSLNLQVQA